MAKETTTFLKHIQKRAELAKSTHEAIKLLCEGYKFTWARTSPKEGEAKRLLLSNLWSAYIIDGSVQMLMENPEPQSQPKDVEIANQHIQSIWQAVWAAKEEQPINGKIDSIQTCADTIKNDLNQSLNGEQLLTAALVLDTAQTFNFIPDQHIWNAASKWVWDNYICRPLWIKDTHYGFDPINGGFILRRGEIATEGCRELINIRLKELKEETSTDNTPPQTEVVHINPVFPYQKSTYEELNETLQDFQEETWKQLAIRPRWHRLLVGRTGTGKTHIAKSLAGENNLPILAISASNWIPLGAQDRGAKITWVTITEFLDDNPAGIIFIDEIDKIHGKTPWNTYLQTEIYSLLDGTIPAGSGENDSLSLDTTELQTRLRETHLIIAAGAFQDQLETLQKKELGFGATEDTPERKVDHQELAKTLSRELVNRFGEILHVPFPNKLDYIEMERSTIKQLPKELQGHFLSTMDEVRTEAIRQGWGARTMELALSKALRRARKSRKTPIEKGAIKKVTPNTLELSSLEPSLEDDWHIPPEQPPAEKIVKTAEIGTCNDSSRPHGAELEGCVLCYDGKPVQNQNVSNVLTILGIQ